MEEMLSICHQCQHGAEPGNLTHCNSVAMIKWHLDKCQDLFETDLTGLRYVPYIQVVDATEKKKCKWFEERHADEQKHPTFIDCLLREINSHTDTKEPTQGTK